MKPVALSTILIFFIVNAFSQDTLKTNMAHLEKKCRNNHCHYRINGFPASEARYIKMEHLKANDESCNFCWMKMFKGKWLYSEGIMVQDAFAGPFIYYFRNGKVKQKGQMIPVNLPDGSTNYVADGVWIFYNRKGKEIRKITYSSGVLISETQ